MIPNIGPLEIGVLLLLALVVFGPRRLPELGKSLGGGLRQFRAGIRGSDDEGAGRRSAVDATAAPTAAPPQDTTRTSRESH
ncbi:MAG: twin-arginine translocase TatA/TatE family subunit [Solirubrobacterales bacterium]